MEEEPIQETYGPPFHSILCEPLSKEALLSKEVVGGPPSPGCPCQRPRQPFPSFPWLKPLQLTAL